MLKTLIKTFFLMLLSISAHAAEHPKAVYTDILAPIGRSVHVGGWYGYEHWRLRVAAAEIFIPSDHYPDQNLDSLNTYWLGACGDYFFEQDFFSWYLLAGMAYSYYRYQLDDGTDGGFSLWHWIVGAGHEYYLNENWHIGGELRAAIPIGLISNRPLGDDNLRPNRVIPSFSINLGYRF